MKKGWVSTLTATALVLSATASFSPAALADNSQHSESVIQLAALDSVFAKAAAEFNVPKELLMAISYQESRWQQVYEDHDHAETELKNNGQGMMHLGDNSVRKGLSEAAVALGVSKDEIIDNYELNVRGGAYLLSKLQQELNKTLSKDLNDWYEAVAMYLGSTDKKLAASYADDVYKLIKNGVSLSAPELGSLQLAAHKNLAPKKGSYQGLTSQGIIGTESTDYAPAIWNAAYSGNFATATRPTSNPINHVIIHDTEGSYQGAISWFKDPAAQVSAHYVIRSSDGQVTQMVQEKDIAWHARSYNTNGIGIEHEGYAAQTGWYTEAMYKSSAALTRAICLKYNIPMTRDNILGHYELYGNTHTDPGNNWDWNKYMSYVTGVTKNYSVVMVDNSSSGFTKYGSDTYWRNVSGLGINNSMIWTNGMSSTAADSNYAIWKPTIPTAGNYEVKVFVPSANAATTKANYKIYYNGGSVTKTVSQANYSNQWVSLGTYNFAAGTAGYVRLGDANGEVASIGFDAMKFMAK